MVMRRPLKCRLRCAQTSLASQHWTCSYTDFGRGIYAGLLGDFFLLADNAYVCRPNVIVPGDDDDFNYEQSQMRINIECAFGELIRRWGVFWRPLEVRFDRRAKLIGTCIRLHNFCIDERLDVDNYTETWTPFRSHPGGIQRPPKLDRDSRPVEVLSLTFTNALGKGPPVALRGSNLTIATNSMVRAKLEEDCRNKGLKRPPTSTFNKNEIGLY